jgi:hypothetical protein
VCKEGHQGGEKEYPEVGRPTAEAGAVIVSVGAGSHNWADGCDGCGECALEPREVLDILSVRVGSLQEVKPDVEVQSLGLRARELKVLAELLCEGSELEVEPEGCAGATWWPASQ